MRIKNEVFIIKLVSVKFGKYSNSFISEGIYVAKKSNIPIISLEDVFEI